MAAMAIALGIVLLALGGVAFAAYRYDRATADRILPGVMVAGVDVGGMTRAEALDAVGAEASARLDAPMTIRVGGRSWTITPSELGETANLAAAVDRAFQGSASVGFVTRVWHRVRQEPVDIAVDLTLASSAEGVESFVSTVAEQMARTPRNASVSVVDGKVTFVRSQPGRALGVNVATRRILAALTEGTATLRLPMEVVKPQVPSAKLGKTIVVDRSVNELSFYDGFDLVKRYPVATAAPGYVTPPGVWSVIDKKENPTWYNPAPDTWGANMPASIPPGPGNPLGTRALYLNAHGIRIHGSYDSASIGTYASHGCIRLQVSDAEELYPLVPVGTRVIIV